MSAGRSPSADRSRLDQPLVEGRGGGDRTPGVPFEPVGAGASPIRTDPRPSNPSFASGNVGRLPDEDFCADLDAVVEVDHVGIVEAKAARRNGVPDRLRLVGSVDAEDGVTEIEGSRPEGIARTARHEPRQIGLPSDHFRWGAPVWPLLFLGHPLDARPLETDAPDADAIADGPIVRLDEVEIALARIDDDRSGRLARMERHDLPRIGVVRLLLVRGSLLRCLALDVYGDLLCDRDRSGKRGRENGDRDGQPSAQQKRRCGNHQTLPLPPTVAARRGGATETTRRGRCSISAFSPRGLSAGDANVVAADVGRVALDRAFETSGLGG